MNRVEIQPVTPALLTAVVDLDRLCFGKLWTLEAYQREIDSPNSDLLALILNPGEPQAVVIGIGCQWAILEEAHITIVGIHPDYQHQGLGQFLMQALLTAAKDRGLERATLEVRDSNTAALKLYEKFGFKVAGRRKRYYQDTGEDALILWRGDLHHPEFADQLAELNQQVRDRLQQHYGWVC